MPKQDLQNTSQRDFNRRGAITTDRPSSSRLGLLLAASMLVFLAAAGLAALGFFAQ